LGNISPDELAFELAHQCLRGNDYSSELLQALVRQALSEDPEEARRASHALFQTVVERLADLFEPCLADCYAALFSEVIATVLPELDRAALLARFRRVRRGRAPRVDPKRVFVLSRVTLGADIAITSVLLDGLKKRYPRADVIFVGPRKNFQLFSGDSRLHFAETAYLRDGTLAGRLGRYHELRAILSQDEEALVVDPDSRLTQLGLLPVCPEEQHLFFETRTYGDYGEESLGLLSQRWVAEVFGVDDACGYVAPSARAEERFDCTVSLGVGENPSKRLGDRFEREWLKELAAGGRRVLLDRGGSVEESQRAERAAEGLAGVRLFSGAFAEFAAFVAASGFYCGYDSAGQHVAAAAGVPLVCVFAGYPCDRFLARWNPFGAGWRRVIAVPEGERESPLEAVKRALQEISTGEQKSHLAFPEKSANNNDLN
jgi:ADP-heptose:LPS heptosyltransferase